MLYKHYKHFKFTIKKYPYKKKTGTRCRIFVINVPLAIERRVQSRPDALRTAASYGRRLSGVRLARATYRTPPSTFQPTSRYLIRVAVVESESGP